MYKLTAFYRSMSAYPANARIVQASNKAFYLFIVHERVGTVYHKKGTFEDCLNALFSFSPFGYGGKTIYWRKEKI